jgi:RNA polymerase sigma factor (sigma-70 family)
MGLGDHDAACAFVRRFEGRVYGLAVLILRDSTLAEDIAQEAFTRAWRNAGAYDPRRGTVLTWLLSITRNLAIDALRLRHQAPTPAETMATLQIPSTDPGPADITLRTERVRDVRGAVAQLPDHQRRALVLSAFFGQTAQEIAAFEGIPLGTAKTRIRTALLKLKPMLIEESVAP